MRLVNYYRYLAICSEFKVVIAVFYDLVFKPFQNKQQLRVGNRSVAGCYQFLKVETYEIGVCVKACRSVPKVGISSAATEFRQIVGKNFITGTIVFVRFRRYPFVGEFRKVVERRIIIRFKTLKTAVFVYAFFRVNFGSQAIQKFQTIGRKSGNRRFIKLFQKLKVGEITVSTSVLVFIAERYYNVKRIYFSEFRRSDVKHFPVQVFGQFRIFVFGIENIDFCSARGEMRKQRFRGVTLTATGLADNYNIAVNEFRIAFEKIHEYGQPVLSEK